MSNIDTAFGSLMLSEAKKELREALGPELARKLLEKHLDVVGSNKEYFVHWVRYPGLFEEDLYAGDMSGYVSADNIYEARAKGIHFLLNHLRENTPKGGCMDCGKELPWPLAYRDFLRCPWCGSASTDWVPLEDIGVAVDDKLDDLAGARASWGDYPLGALIHSVLKAKVDEAIVEYEWFDAGSDIGLLEDIDEILVDLILAATVAREKVELLKARAPDGVNAVSETHKPEVDTREYKKACECGSNKRTTTKFSTSDGEASLVKCADCGKTLDMKLK